MEATFPCTSKRWPGAWARTSSSCSWPTTSCTSSGLASPSKKGRRSPYVSRSQRKERTTGSLKVHTNAWPLPGLCVGACLLVSHNENNPCPLVLQRCWLQLPHIAHGDGGRCHRADLCVLFGICRMGRAP